MAQPKWQAFRPLRSFRFHPDGRLRRLVESGVVFVAVEPPRFRPGGILSRASYPTNVRAEGQLIGVHADAVELLSDFRDDVEIIQL
jgi:hypothetical protein